MCKECLRGRVTEIIEGKREGGSLGRVQNAQGKKEHSLNQEGKSKKECLRGSTTGNEGGREGGREIKEKI